MANHRIQNAKISELITVDNTLADYISSQGLFRVNDGNFTCSLNDYINNNSTRSVKIKFKDYSLEFRYTHEMYKSIKLHVRLSDTINNYFFDLDYIPYFCGAILISGGATHHNSTIKEKDCKLVIKFCYKSIFNKTVDADQKLVFFDKVEGYLKTMFSSAIKLIQYKNVNSSNEVGIFLLNLND